MVRADSLYYLREKLRVTNPFFDEVAGDYFYSFVLECWERRPRCSRSTCRVCGKLSRRPVVMERVGHISIETHVLHGRAAFQHRLPTQRLRHTCKHTHRTEAHPRARASTTRMVRDRKLGLTD